MNQLEQLLNSLIKIGWKPWNVDVNCDISIKIENNRIKIYFELKTGVIVSNSGGMSLRELVSLESGLWRFVCKNKLYKDNNDIYPHIDRIIEDNYYQDVVLEKEEYTISYHKYRLLESALVPEEELGQFLVDNIIVEGLKSEQSKR